MKRIFIIIILFFCLDVYSSNNNGILKVSNCFADTGGELQNVTVEGKGEIFSTEKLTDIVIKIYKSSGRWEAYKISKEKATISLVGDDVFIAITKLPEENLYYVSFLVSQHNDTKNINNMRRGILEGFSVFNVRPTISYLIIGKYPYKMAISEMTSKADEIIKSSGAELINLISDRNLISVIGLLPHLQEKVKIENNISNINIALRYNSLEKSTYIWIGCPIISIEY